MNVHIGRLVHVDEELGLQVHLINFLRQLGRDGDGRRADALEYRLDCLGKQWQWHWPQVHLVLFVATQLRHFATQKRHNSAYEQLLQISKFIGHLASNQRKSISVYAMISDAVGHPLVEFEVAAAGGQTSQINVEYERLTVEQDRQGLQVLRHVEDPRQSYVLLGVLRLRVPVGHRVHDQRSYDVRVGALVPCMLQYYGRIWMVS